MIQTIELTLIDFKDRYPLFNEIWNEIARPYPGKSIKWIIENVHNEKIPQRTQGHFEYNMPGEVEQPVKYTPGQSVQTETKLEAFLRNIYNIEICRDQQVSILNAFDSVNRLPDITGIRQLRNILLKNIEYLQKNELKIGRFEIIPDVKEVYRQNRFNDFESFSKEFLKRAAPELTQGKIPSFAFGWTSYSYLVGHIEQIATQIKNYYNAEEFNGKNLGVCFLEVYKLAFWFERSHYQLYDSDIIDRANYRKTRKNGAQATNEQKQRCYPKMKIKAAEIASNHHDYSISKAAEKLSSMFHISTKKIKEVCKSELEPLNIRKKTKNS